MTSTDRLALGGTGRGGTGVAVVCDNLRMRVTHLSARGLFSFGADPFNLHLGHADLSVIVGPNASGKSNLGALVDLVVAAVTWSGSLSEVSQLSLDQQPLSAALASAALRTRHRGLPEGSEVEVRLGVDLTGDDERELVASFMRAAIASSPPATSSQRDLRLESWAAELPTEAFRALFQGELVVSHNGVAGSHWRVRFEPSEKIGDAHVVVLLKSYEAMLVLVGEPLPSDRRADLGALLGFDPSRENAEPQTSPPGPGSVLDRLVPAPGSGTILTFRCASSSPELLPEASRAFLRRASLESTLRPNSTWGPGVVWERILRNGVRHLRAQGAALTGFDETGLPRGQWTYGPAALAEPAGPEVTDLPRRLWELHNSGPGSTGRLEGVHKEFRELAPGWEFAIAGSLEPSARPAEHLALQLAAEPATGMLAGSIPYQRVRAIPADSTPEQADLDVNLRVQLSACRNDGDWEPLAGAGTGVAQALVLAEALGDASGRFVFLDEPAVNLHPSWQRLVRSRLEALSAPKAAGESGQFLLVTHAASLAAPIRSSSPLPIRLTRDDVASTVIGPPREDLPNDWPRDLQLSAEGWGLLFSDAVILVEGETELGALPRWFDKISQEENKRPWSGRNIALFSAGGDRGFESWGRYLTHYGVPWVVVCDGMILDPYPPVLPKKSSGNKAADKEVAPVTWNKSKNWVLLQVARARGQDASSEAVEKMREEPGHMRPETPTFDEVTTMGERFGIFTLANWFAKEDKQPDPPGEILSIESIDDLIARDEHLHLAKKRACAELGDRRSKVRVGLYVAEACDPPTVVRSVYNKIVARLDP